ncbi:ribosome silencing factor [Bifidobacterium margollesii]|uniref:ribosome silencing factor n=1 Tax=Bifidobacterium margollesii TaxID=2020964 RepID=UPI000C786EC0|nr:ribosome silencing factor [Bifidobacterium margollesii]
MTAAQDSIDAVRIAAQAADSIKARDIVAFDVSEPLGITDAFVIASGSSDRHVVSIADEIERRLSEQRGIKPLENEGRDQGQWVLLDYGDFVVHVMYQETREYYDLERLWKDCPMISLGLAHPESSEQVSVHDPAGAGSEEPEDSEDSEDEERS